MSLPEPITETGDFPTRVPLPLVFESETASLDPLLFQNLTSLVGDVASSKDAYAADALSEALEGAFDALSRCIYRISSSTPSEDAVEIPDYGALRRAIFTFQISDSDDSSFVPVLLFEVVPFIASLVLRMPQVFGPPRPPLSYLRQIPLSGDEDSKNCAFFDSVCQLSRLECACLVACGFFGGYGFLRFDGRTQRRPDWCRCLNEMNFDGMFQMSAGASYVVGKIQAILNYFRHLEMEILEDRVRGVRIQRSYIPSHLYDGCLQEVSQSCLCPVRVLYPSYIEDILPGDPSRSPIRHADFANRFVGGGAIGAGAVQEEIMFATHPELFVSSLLCPCLTHDEVIFVRGAKKFSSMKGYGRRLQFGGDFVEKEGAKCRREDYVEIVAMDAIDLRGQSDHDGEKFQYDTEFLRREIWKSRIAFANTWVVSTGNWGCGAFRGDKELKFVQQWIGATMAGVEELVYNLPEGSRDAPFQPAFADFVAFVRSDAETFTVGRLHEALFDVAGRVWDSEVGLLGLIRGKLSV